MDYELWKNYKIFLTKLSFSTVMIFLLIFFGFLLTFIILISTTIIFSILYVMFKHKKIKEFSKLNKFLSFVASTFTKKDWLTVLAAFTISFASIWTFYKFVTYDIVFITIIGFLIFGGTNNITKFIVDTWKPKKRVFSTTFEFILISFILNLIMFYFLGFKIYLSIYFAFLIAILHIIPWLDHNLVLLLYFHIIYLLFFLI